MTKPVRAFRDLRKYLNCILKDYDVMITLIDCVQLFPDTF